MNKMLLALFIPEDTLLVQTDIMFFMLWVWCKDKMNKTIYEEQERSYSGFQSRCLEIRSGNEEAINSTRNRIYSGFAQS